MQDTLTPSTANVNVQENSTSTIALIDLLRKTIVDEVKANSDEILDKMLPVLADIIKEEVDKLSENQDSNDKLRESIMKDWEDITKVYEAKIVDKISEIKPIQYTIVVNSNQVDLPTGTILHKEFKKVLGVITNKLYCLMVGPAGSGKTQLAEQVAKALNLDFYAMSIGQQTTQTPIMGYMSANGDYVTTEFRKAYENGGLFLLDEIDAGNANVLTVLNSALANGFCSFPDHQIRKHENFRLIASANTFGNGNNGEYVGRNKLDAATLDRFITVTIDYDDEMEDKLCDNKSWLELYRQIRTAARLHSVKAIFSTRKLLAGQQLFTMQDEAGENIYSFTDIFDMLWQGSVTIDNKDRILQYIYQQSEEAKSIK